MRRCWATFYPGKNHGRLNRRHFAPEAVDGRAMVNPHYGNLLDLGEGLPLLPGTRAICDSGAFQERDMLKRLLAGAALDRQLALEQRLRDEGCGPDFCFEAIVTYDCLVGVDEAIVNGKRIKRRGDEASAVGAVEATIASAAIYHRRRKEVRGAIAYAAQGASIPQYVACVRRLLPLLRPGLDWIALGGFCIIGMQRSLIPQFVETCRVLAPLLAAHGVPRVHVLGVCVVDALQAAADIFAAVGIELSTDSVSMETNAIMGREWDERHMQRRPGASPFLQRWKPADKLVNYHPVDLAIGNIRRFSAWLDRQGCGEARHRPLVPYQGSLFL